MSFVIDHKALVRPSVWRHSSALRRANPIRGALRVGFMQRSFTALLWPRSSQRFGRCLIATCLVLVAFGYAPTSAQEAQLPGFTLPHGMYAANSPSCANVPMAGIVTYDGRGFNPNKQTCRAVATSQPQTYELTCTDNLQPAPKTPEKITVKISQLSKTSFRLNADIYTYCKE